MRRDLAKCTTESYRLGRGYAAFYKLKFGGRVPVSHEPEFDYPEERGGFRSSARGRHKNHKRFSDRLGALRGFIRGHLGRPWNDVFNEFCRSVDRRSLSGYHLWTHLVQEVTTDTFILDGSAGQVSERLRFSGVRPVTGFYVHPVTGVLECERTSPYLTKRQWREKRKQEAPIDLPVPGNEGWRYKQFGGLWFRYRVIEKSRLTGEELIQRKSANKREIAWIQRKRKLAGWIG